ncbi:MAG: fatty acid desaturase [Planctomycetes bacterium]|nr:fatty acid desaturase [Planctomycetota bacterium]
MLTVAPSARPADELDAFKNPGFQKRVNELRQPDNVTNWFYIAREYLILAVVLGVPLAFYHFYDAWGLHWLWNVPVTFATILLVGMCQHRIGNLGHEGGHYALFRNRLLNELASNWFALYPLWGITHTYRLQHLAHHQYLNDPERDPDIIYMNYLGQTFRLPMPARQFLWACVLRHLVWLPNLLRYIFDRARFANIGGISGPYKAKNANSPIILAVNMTHYAALVSLLALAVWQRIAWLIAAAPVFLLPLLLVATILLPNRLYMKTAVKPDIAPKWAIFQRAIYATLLFTGLAWMTYWTGLPWPLFYFVLWLVPLGTTFSFFMILREDIQHSNVEEGRFTHSRDFRGNVLVKWAVFPMGQAYHLPHHLYPMVPHYNLKKLERLLRELDIYRENAVVVDRLLPPHAAAL